MLRCWTSSLEKELSTTCFVSASVCVAFLTIDFKFPARIRCQWEEEAWAADSSQVWRVLIGTSGSVAFDIARDPKQNLLKVLLGRH